MLKRGRLEEDPSVAAAAACGWLSGWRAGSCTAAAAHLRQRLEGQLHKGDVQGTQLQGGRAEGKAVHAAHGSRPAAAAAAHSHVPSQPMHTACVLNAATTWTPFKGVPQCTAPALAHLVNAGRPQLRVATLKDGQAPQQVGQLLQVELLAGHARLDLCGGAEQATGRGAALIARRAACGQCAGSSTAEHCLQRPGCRQPAISPTRRTPATSAVIRPGVDHLSEAYAQMMLVTCCSDSSPAIASARSEGGGSKLGTNGAGCMGCKAGEART